jgi:hypothetical protein
MADETTTKSPSTRKPKTPSANISPEALKAMLDSMNEMRAMVDKYKAEAEAAHKAMAAKQAEPAKGKSQISASNEWKTVTAFKKAGFGAVTPHVDVMTFNRWVAAGFRPKEGSKSVAVNGLRLFCRQQVRPLTDEDRGKLAEQEAKREARKAGQGNVSQLHPAN